MPAEKITVFCFGASYALALLLEMICLFWRRPLLRLGSSMLACAGLLAHTLFLAAQRPPISTQFGSLLFLAWIIGIFYVYGSFHYSHLAWGIFVLPVVLGLTLLAGVFSGMKVSGEPSWVEKVLLFKTGAFWGALHGGLLMMAAVGVCVGFVASVMYLVQAHRLRAKTLPGQGLRLLSLERLEKMNRRAINLAFPLLTAGVIVGAVLLVQDGETSRGWADAKVWGSVVLWLVFTILLYLRYGVHAQGRRLALLTIVAFALLVATLISPSHRFVQGGGP